MRRGSIFRGRSSPTGAARAVVAETSALASSDGVDVGDLDQGVAHLFLLVADGLAAAVAALIADDRGTARGLMSADRHLDALSESVEGVAERALLSRQYRTPEQRRMLLLVVQIVPEIERSGDLVEHIAARAAQGVGTALNDDTRDLIEQMGEIGVDMWRSAARAYADRDPAASIGLRVVDDELDDLHVRLTEAMAATKMSVAAAIELGLVGRFLERIGDHAVNITRRLECERGGVMALNDEAAVLALREAVDIARRTADGLALLRVTPPSNQTLEVVSDTLVALSDHLAAVAHECSYGSTVRQSIDDVRTDLDAHLRAAMAMVDLQLPRQCTTVLSRIARRVAAELEITVGDMEALHAV